MKNIYNEEIKNNDVSKIDFSYIGEVPSNQIPLYMDFLKTTSDKTSYAVRHMSKKIIKKIQKSLLE